MIKGSKHSKATRRKMSEAKKGEKNLNWGKGNKNFLGHKHSEESKEKMGISHKGHKVSLVTREKISEANKGKPTWNKGKKHSKETRQKMRISRIKYMTSGRVKAKDTSIEILTENELKRNRIPYIKQCPIEGITLADFLLPNKIIIQCDGGYWHRLPEHQSRDLNQDFQLGFKGYKVYRFWEKDIKKSAKRCINKVLRDI